MSRSNLAAKSGVINGCSLVVQMLFEFVVRKLFIENIGVDYLGLNSVLAEVLGFLSLAELGFQSAIVFQLYKPLAENDHNTVNEIVTVLKKVYRLVGLAVFILGIFSLPFLRFIVKIDNLDVSTIYIAFILLLLSSVVTYFLAYKRTLLYADQKQYTTTFIDMITNIIFSSLKIVVIVTLRDFYLFLVINIIQKIVSNIIVQIYCGKKYSWLKTAAKSSEEIKRSLFVNTKDILIERVAGTVFSSTDNLVISAIIGTSLVGYIGNYKVITTAVKNIITVCLGPVIPIIGNYLQTESLKDSKILLNNYSFLRFSISLILLVPTLLLCNTFVILWLGNEFVMPYVITFLIVFDIYFGCAQGSCGDYIVALGYFKYEKYVFILGALVNILLSVFGAYIIGVNGVLIGTVIGQIVMWIGRSFILYKYYFKNTKKEYLLYWVKQFKYLLVFITTFVVCLLLSNLFKNTNLVVMFILNGIGSVSICLFVILALYKNTTEFNYFKKMFFTVWNNFKNRIRG